MAQHVRVSRPTDDCGAEGDHRLWQELFGSFGDEGEPATIEKVRADGDCVVMAVRSRGQGKASGIPVDVRWAIAFRLRDGKIQRVDVRGDYARALEAAGLSE